MNEKQLQERFLVPFFTKELGYTEVQANTITNSLIIEEDLQAFIAHSKLNKQPYQELLKKYQHNSQQLLNDLIQLIQERMASSRNMALFINNNKSILKKIIKFYNYC